MPGPETAKEKAEAKDVAQASLKKRVSALEAKIEELEAKVTKAVERGEQLRVAVAEGRMDTL